MEAKREYTVALAGNPNVGKSTVFNALTHLHQHTGNWPGKTVSGAVGSFDAGGLTIDLVDVPGAYSLNAHSPEEEVARQYICGEMSDTHRSPPDAVIVVCDACTMLRSLSYAAEIAKLSTPYMLCINLADEAEKRGITVDAALLEELTGVPCVLCAARSGKGLYALTKRLSTLLTGDKTHAKPFSPDEIYAKCVSAPENADRRDRLFDRIFTGKYTALPTSALLLAAVLFLTLKGASPLSNGISYVLTHLGTALRELLHLCRVPDLIVRAFCDGVVGVTFQVCAVMLPPMAIFFPLFTVLEDLGYLPRVAYSFDRCFKGCRACGKQALTMMMGLGCNAAGVTGCRIIDSPRERLVAILTNSFIPCNGRLALITALLVPLTAMLPSSIPLQLPLLMCAVIGFGTVLTLIASALLSATVLRGEASAFTLELPPYRLPSVKQIVIRSVLDRTIFVLGRAVSAAAPAGLVIWLFSYIRIGTDSLFVHGARLLDPIGHFAGMDGVMMLAFILALPASEITLPLMLMGYSGTAISDGILCLDSIAPVVESAGWTPLTAVCAVIFTVAHFPCATTIITVKRETGSSLWAFLSAAIPTAVGYALCALINAAFS